MELEGFVSTPGLSIWKLHPCHSQEVMVWTGRSGDSVDAAFSCLSPAQLLTGWKLYPHCSQGWGVWGSGSAVTTASQLPGLQTKTFATNVLLKPPGLHWTGARIFQPTASKVCQPLHYSV